MYFSDSCYNVKIWHIFAFLMLIQGLCVNCQQYEGDDCGLDGAPGSCTLIDSCPDVLRNISSKRPQICGFTGTTPIVCCPKVLKNETVQTNKKNYPGEKAKQKCLEYSSYIYEWVLPENETDPEKKVRVNRCGHIITALQIGHDYVSLREYPHMALLGRKRPDDTRDWICGGSLISEKFVLTAAHCSILFDGTSTQLRWVRLGEYSLDIAHESEYQDFGIDEIIRHPEYHPIINLQNDIALLKLDRRATINKFVIPACLHTEYEIDNEKVTATGWGPGVRGEGLRFDLAKVELEMFTLEECRDIYVNISIITDRMLCAGHRTLNRGTCIGDSGGPLQVYLKNPYCMYDVIGVTSFGKKECGMSGIPQVYTRVSHYIEWIESVVWP